MKKVALLLVMFNVILLTSCTDSSLEDLPNETQEKELQSTTPGNDGTIGADDEDEETGRE